MNTCEGIVERVEGEWAWVSTQPAPACGSCSQRDGCGGTSVLETGLPRGKARVLKLPNTIRASPGDAVLIHAAAGTIWQAVWRAYLIPLLLGVGAALLAKHFAAGEGGIFLALLGGLAAGFLVLRWLDSRRRRPILSIEFKH
ncbi:MAG: SoxR reducing system RseC family protein [Rhodocyclaceae bacterium]|nr:SoxR reducing system RseC family protein [Rhodocyclaceae bacterium]